jgi:cytoskeletal protein RodZ
MSLINDALKRAAADKPRDAQSPAATPVMQPVDFPPVKPSHILPWALLLLGVGAVGIAAGLWFGVGRTQQLAATPPNTAPAAAASQPQVAPAQPALNPIQQTTKTLQAVVSRNDEGTSNHSPIQSPPPAARNPVVVAKALPSPVPSPSAAPKKAAAQTATEPKAIRLQSIFYRMKSPSVIINGKTLGLGDTVDGIKVVSIQRTSVEVVQNGKYRTLTLQD